MRGEETLEGEGRGGVATLGAGARGLRGELCWAGRGGEGGELKLGLETSSFGLLIEMGSMSQLARGQGGRQGGGGALLPKRCLMILGFGSDGLVWMSGALQPISIKRGGEYEPASKR